MIGWTRRRLLTGVVGGAVTGMVRRPSAARKGGGTGTAPGWSYPMALPGRPPGDGFLIRHGFTTENTWYFPDHWHTAEDWYALAGDTAGAPVVAIAAGEVVYVGSNYPGLVVIVRHEAELYSMYGHLDPVVTVEVGETVVRGATLGTVLFRGDDVPNHLHFEVRTFLTTTEVNGAAPRYGFACGVECPPGPGYWPIDAPEHPAAIGWRNPTHVIARRSYVGALPASAEVVVATGAAAAATLWSRPDYQTGAEPVGTLPLTAGNRLPLLAIVAGREAARESGADAYRVWYQIALPDSDRAWARAAIPSTNDTDSDGRPSSVRFDLLPAIDAD